MLFDLDADPHEQTDLADLKPELVEKGKAILSKWKEDELERATHKVDPLETVMSEGGPYLAVMVMSEGDGSRGLGIEFETREQFYRV